VLFHCARALKLLAVLLSCKKAKVKGAHKIPFSDNIYAKSEPRPLLNLETKEIPKNGAAIKNAVTCLMRLTVIVAMHSIAAFVAPRCVTAHAAAEPATAASADATRKCS
jgi:hypothetical protein